MTDVPTERIGASLDEHFAEVAERLPEPVGAAPDPELQDHVTG